MKARSKRARRITPELLSLPEAARLVGYDYRVFFRRVVRGGAMPLFRDGRVLRVRRADVAKWIDDHTTGRADE